MTPNKTPKELGYRMPAEWEPHEATWLTWPKDPQTWPDRVPQAEEAFARMIEALTPTERVDLLVDDAAAEEKVRKKLSEKKVTHSNLSIHHVPTVDSWIRDYGPIFLTRSSPEGKALILDFIFNAWGDKYESLKADDPIPKHIASLLNFPVVEPGIVLEGGSIEVNGRGTLLTTEQCLLNPRRNPRLSKTEIEAVLQAYLGVDRVLWLGEGIAGDDTDGHVDDITRFVAPDTVVTAVEEDPADENFAPLRDNLRRLQKMTDEGGRSLKIVPLPMPGRVETEAGRLPASYANFYLANGLVLVPVFGHPNDPKALNTLQELFPKRKVVGIEANDLVWGLGAVHCLTQQQPRAYT
jgi:agmatine deiminase